VPALNSATKAHFYSANRAYFHLVFFFKEKKVAELRGNNAHTQQKKRKKKRAN
jgi:hypothetical protein